MARAKFSVTAFLEECKEFGDDPVKYFENLDRDMTYKSLMLRFVMRRFRTIKEEYIKEILRLTNFNLLNAKESLENPPNDMIMITESSLGCDTDVLNEPDCPVAFKREVLFFEHKTEILEYLNSAKLKKSLAVDMGQYLFCECCLADDVPLDQIIACRDGHLFCVDCIMNYVHTTVKEGRLEFKCMFFQFCRGSLLTSRLEKIISPAEIERLNAESQVQGIKRAHLPGVEFCPACNYAAVLEDKDSLFRCQKCRVVTCRRCKIDHGPSGECPLRQPEQPPAPLQPFGAVLPVPAPSGQEVQPPVPHGDYQDDDYDEDDPDYHGGDWDDEDDDGDYAEFPGADFDPDYDDDDDDFLYNDYDPDDDVEDADNPGGQPDEGLEGPVNSEEEDEDFANADDFIEDDYDGDYYSGEEEEGENDGNVAAEEPPGNPEFDDYELMEGEEEEDYEAGDVDMTDPPLGDDPLDRLDELQDGLPDYFVDDDDPDDYDGRDYYDEDDDLYDDYPDYDDDDGEDFD